MKTVRSSGRRSVGVGGSWDRGDISLTISSIVKSPTALTSFPI